MREITLEEARPFLQKALDLAGNTHTLEDVREGIEAGRLQFWPGVNSAIITEIIEYPQKRTLHFFLAGGNLAEIEAMYPAVEQFGREQGCIAASTVGRPGWERTFLKRGGWKPRAVFMMKEL